MTEQTEHPNAVAVRRSFEACTHRHSAWRSAMNEHPNAVTVLRSFAAWNSGDLDVIREYFTEDAILHFAGNNAMSGTYRGRDALMDALGRATQGWGPRTEMEAILASDDHVFAVFHAIFDGDDKRCPFTGQEHAPGRIG
jgi:uncharacterized protein